MTIDQLIKYLAVLAAVLIVVAYFQGATGLLTTLGTAVGTLFQIGTGTIPASSVGSNPNSAPVIGGNPRRRF